MKRIPSLLLALALLLTLAGCGGTAPKSPEDVPPVVASDTPGGEAAAPEPSAKPQEPVNTPEPEASPEPLKPEKPKSPTLAQRLEGVYLSYDDPEAEEHRIHIIPIGGTLLIENQLFIEDCLYSFWAQELRPQDARALSGDADTVSAPSMAFSYMTSGGQYLEPVTQLTVALEEDGLTLTEGVDRRHFEPMADAQSLHEITQEDCQAYGLVQTNPLGEKLVGDWCYSDEDAAVWLSLGADGSFLGALKLKDEPIKVNIGAWGIDGNGELAVLAQRPETGTMPYLWRLAWERTADGIDLAVTASYDDYLLPGEGSCVLAPAEWDWRIPDGLYGGGSGAFTYEDMRSGVFVNPDTGDVIDYAYNMQLLDETLPGAVEFNADMNQSMGKLIWAQWDAIDSGDVPEYTSIICQSYEYEGLCSFVYALTRWIDNQEEYEVYHFDRNAGTWLHSNDVLAQLGLDFFGDFLPACVEAGQAQIMDAYAGSSLPQEELDNLLEETKQYVGLYDVEPFIAEDGTIWATVPVASIAGAGYYYRLLPLSLRSR